MDEQNFYSLGLLKTPSREQSHATVSPVVAMVDRVRKRIHAEKVLQDPKPQPHPPRTTSSNWAKRNSHRFSSTSTIATFVTASQGTPSSPGSSSVSDTATPETPITPPDSDCKSEYTTPSIIVTPPEHTISDNTSDSDLECSLSLTSTNLAFFPSPPTGNKRSPLPAPRKPMTAAEIQVWKDLTDNIVKGFLAANEMLTKRLERLKERAKVAGEQVYLERVDGMIEACLERRQRLAVEGERVHARFEKWGECEEMERKGGEILNLGR